jgi:uncharacterized protein YjbJ (UPF0337 family)
MKPSTKDNVKGTFHEVKGKVKEKTGQVTNNPRLEAEGKAENTAGKVEKKVGQIEKCSRSKLGGLCPEPLYSGRLQWISTDDMRGSGRFDLHRAVLTNIEEIWPSSSLIFRRVSPSQVRPTK